MRRQDVLIIHTRDEDGLSKPMNFEDIRMHALPLAREDIPQADNGVFAIRVSISTAVKFITDLKDREEAAFFFAKMSLLVLILGISIQVRHLVSVLPSKLKHGLRL